MNELGLDQKDLASAAQVTESYISQLLARKKAPPAPARTDIYEKIGLFLNVPSEELSMLAELQRRTDLKKKVGDCPTALLQDCRLLILRKCNGGRRAAVQRIIEKDSFGELERLVAQTIVEVVQNVAREELRNEEWLRRLAQQSGRSFEQMRVAILEFLDADIFQVSAEHCALFLDPILETWDIVLKTFAMEVILSPRLSPRGVLRFAYVESSARTDAPFEEALEQFLRDTSLSGDVTKEEVEFLRSLRFRGRRPTPLYYYRELQNLRDPLHFRAVN
ncbi:helix-turn-helix domain-containing protein [Bryobacter aggregatus]|uniref:helix-turn-helix domain-containing protein n=1 Tax=Bryobacter aggregatus TaxID=360054 RepID=UPI001EE32CA8|nr:helix-turn-helix transcriptional regulator [Bryobacter aggregatus]